jgi:soluble lytic murein transglycosylase-like protein
MFSYESIAKADDVNPERIARVSAILHGLDPDLFVAILIVESNMRLNAYNAETKDYGIAQINIHTARAFKFDTARLLTDLRYSIDAGAKVLADFQKRYKDKEPDIFYCRYNQGSGKLKGIKLRRCMNYIAKVERAMLY